MSAQPSALSSTAKAVTAAVPLRRRTRVLPYSSQASSLQSTGPGAYAAAARRQRARRRRHRGGRGPLALFRRVTSAVTQSPRADDVSEECLAPLLPPLQPGQVLRDLPFFTQNAEVHYFSTHPSLLDAVFGLGHGQRLRFSCGPWAGQEAMVIGARGGAVWVLLRSETIARELPLPSCYAPSQLSVYAVNPTGEEDSDDDDDTARPSLTDREKRSGKASTSPSSPAVAVRLVRRQLERQYGMEVLPMDDESTSAEATHRIAAEVTHSAPFGIADLVQAAQAQAERLFTPEQRAFLQCAPDLFVSVVDEDSEDYPVAGDGSAAATAQAGARPPEGDDDGLSFYQRAVSTTATEGMPSSRRPRSLSPSNSAMRHDHEGSPTGRRLRGAGRVVLLSPRVLSASGTLGWGGEGAVVVRGGGVHAFTASMSASIVI